MLDLDKEMTELESKSKQNLNNDDSKIELLESELKGMKNKDLKKLKTVPGKPGYRYVPLKK